MATTTLLEALKRARESSTSSGRASHSAPIDRDTANQVGGASTAYNSIGSEDRRALPLPQVSVSVTNIINPVITIVNKQIGNHVGKQQAKSSVDPEVLLPLLGSYCCAAKCMTLLTLRDMEELVLHFHPANSPHPRAHFNQVASNWLHSCLIATEDDSPFSTRIGGRRFDLKLNSLLKAKRDNILRVKCVTAACNVSRCHHSTLETLAVNLGSQGSLATISPVKRLYTKKAMVSAWADQLINEFSAVKRSSDNESERFLLGFASLRDVYEYYVHKVNLVGDQQEKNFYISIEESYFTKVFNQRMAEKKVSLHHVHSCATCGRYEFELRKLSSQEKQGEAFDPDYRNHLLAEQKEHLDKSRALRDFWKEQVHSMSASFITTRKRTSICKIEDNMSTVLLPSARSLFVQKTRSYSDFLQCHMGGIQTILGPSNSKTKYFPFSEAVANENTNTILTELLMDLIDDLNEFTDLHEVILLLDRHTTGWNKTVVAFYQFMVDLGALRKVVMLSFDPGHHINALDHTNSITSRAYIAASKRTFAGIVDMDAAIDVLQKASATFRIIPLFCVLDFKAAFDNINIAPGPHMKAHIIEITAAGIRSKQHPREQWNSFFGGGVADYHRFVPQGTALPVVLVAAIQGLDADHLEEVRKVVFAARLENTPYWVSILGGGVGGEPNVNPFDIAVLPRRNAFVPVAVAFAPPNNESIAPPAVPPTLGEEVGTRSVLNHRPSTGHEQSYQFRVFFDDDTIEWLELDDLVDLDYTINESLERYLAQHPQVKTKGTTTKFCL